MTNFCSWNFQAEAVKANLPKKMCDGNAQTTQQLSGTFVIASQNPATINRESQPSALKPPTEHFNASMKSLKYEFQT